MTKTTLRSGTLLSAILGTLAAAAATRCGGVTEGEPAQAEPKRDADTSNNGETGATIDAHGHVADTGPRVDAPLQVRDAAAGLIGPGPECNARRVSDQQMSNSTCSGVDAGHSGIALVCYELPRAPLTCTSTYGNDCIVTGYSCGLVQTGDHVGCGPLPQRTDACCWEVLGGCAVGRPFTVAGQARVARMESTSEWASEITPSLDGLDEATRHALAQVWTDEGCSEHASVASFARSVLELCALGAPAHLIAGALRAGRDEIEHARVAFGLASRYAGRPIGPGCLDVSRALDASSLPEVAVRTAAEGCVAETVSAILIGAASDAATEPAIRAHLARVAKEESEHAVLAWRQLAWLLERGDRALRDRIARVFEEAERHVGIGPVAAAVADAASLRAHGQLPADERRHAARTALAEIVRPAAAQLWLSVSGSGHDTAASTRAAL